MITVYRYGFMHWKVVCADNNDLVIWRFFTKEGAMKRANFMKCAMQNITSKDVEIKVIEG